MSQMLCLNNLRFLTTVGVYPWEHVVKQPVLISLALAVRAPTAEKTPTLEDTIDYVQVRRVIHNVLSTGRFGLVEQLADTVMNTLFEQFPLTSATITVSKPLALNKMNAVSVVVTRQT